jgi:hypothetical protein
MIALAETGSASSRAQTAAATAGRDSRRGVTRSRMHARLRAYVSEL